MNDTLAYCQVVSRLREFFFNKKGFIEVPAQSRLSILAACEDPKTITKFNFDKEYPLPQTGQMWLEYEMLKNPDFNGVFCVTTSYRNEPNPIPGRHLKVFPMFEFESRGDMADLRQLETELIEFLGFDSPISIDYEKACEFYGVNEIEAREETQMQKDFGPSILLESFPERTSPFWNMKHGGEGIFKKIDVLLYGMETIGSAERSCSPEEMRSFFESISEGGYADVLFQKFGEQRVMEELDDYLSLDFFPRFGAGIGVSRMARAMKLAGLLDPHVGNELVELTLESEDTTTFVRDEEKLSKVAVA